MLAGVVDVWPYNPNTEKAVVVQETELAGASTVQLESCCH